MTVIVQTISHATRDWRGRILALLFLSLLVTINATSHSGWLHDVLEQLSGAYLDVGVFVALTLWLFGWLEDKYGVDVAALANASKSREVFIAAALGVMPGCGGAIMIVTYYIHGRLSFTALITALIATMGDAAFLILAVRPMDGLLIMLISVIAAIITGLMISHSKLHHMQHDLPKNPSPASNFKKSVDVLPENLRRLWFLILIPGIAFGIADLTDIDWGRLGYFWEFAHFYVGVAGCVLCLLLWCYHGGTPLTSYRFSNTGKTAISLMTNSLSDNITENRQSSNLEHRVISDTNFVMFWVVVGYLAFYMLETQFEINLMVIAGQSALILPLIAIMVGFLPGCGPQIIITAMYIQGLIPFSALLGNAMNNDGDALFPALALTPKTALIATVLTAVPSLICAYLYFYFIEMI